MGWFDNMYNQSFAGSYQDAARKRNILANEYAANDDDFAYNMDQILRDQQSQAIAGGIVTGLTGTTTLLSNSLKDAQIRDTSMHEGIISDLSRAGNYNYNNYDQLANDYAQTNFNPQFGYQDIRGMTTGQQIGSVGTSALSGAATGLQIGGPWGALIGGVVGLGTGLAGVASGNSAAHVKQNQLNLQANLASEAARQNFAAAHERIGDNIHRQNAVNAVGDGGSIKRRVQSFADSMLMSKRRIKQREHAHQRIQRIHGEGGLTVRFKK